MSPQARAQLLRKMYSAAVAAADPMVVLPRHLPALPQGRTIVVGAGKAAYAMARAVEAHWKGQLEGVVVAPNMAADALPRIRVLEGSHPVPDAFSFVAARSILAAVAGLRPQDLVLALISGGGSALMALPASGVNFQEKQSITRALLRGGATIHELNVVRKHLSAIKGGRLAQAAAPAHVVTLVLSDIPGDEFGLVASGPTVPDISSCIDALAVLDRYDVIISAGLRKQLLDASLETPKPGDDCFLAGETRMIACAQDGLEAAAQVAREGGVTPLILSDRIEGESREVARVHAAIAQQVIRRGQPLGAPCVLLSGGETTVTVTGHGRGGRNTEFSLALALALQGQSGVSALSAGTDGIDGSSDAAGAIVDEDTLERARQLGLDPLTHLMDNDSFTLLSRIGTCIHTGPSGTNINDVRALLIAPETNTP
ncbi:MAG: glycerate kinase [Burkholderiaceae bacterium]|nr:glycerate kinase [Burkholderiaceae bacterium]